MTGDPSVTSVLRRNIAALRRMQDDFEQRRTLQERMADAITRFAGSMRFVYLHASVFTVWFLINTRVIRIVAPFDPYPFVMLAMIASVEAIFLSTFVLISQNRMSKIAARREELNVQTSLLAEHEITRLLNLIDAIARQLGVKAVDERELAELKQDVGPEAVLSEIEKSEAAPPER
jgi:uncharacterized membrane protein